MSSSGFFTRSSMAQFDPVDFNCTTARAALLPKTVDLAGHRMKKIRKAPRHLGAFHIPPFPFLLTLARLRRTIALDRHSVRSFVALPQLGLKTPDGTHVGTRR